jgi:transaldolase
MRKISDLKIKLFADGADLNMMKKMYTERIVQGFTTNPTLMRKAGIQEYELFAKQVMREIPDLPICLEVLSDTFEEMEKEARKISGWGKNVVVKIPITNTKGESSIDLIKKLSGEGIYLNITAILTVGQVEQVARAVSSRANSIVSVFAGRIADTGIDPVPCMKDAAKILRKLPNTQLLWASSRELLNIFQAEDCGCDIITITDDILRKICLVGKDLAELSLDTVKMFYNDAQSVGYKINV